MSRRSSMSLLEEIADTALEPGYAIRSEERAREEAAGRHTPQRKADRRAVHLGLAVVLGIAAFVVALTVTDVRRSAPEAAQTRGQLAERAQDRADATDALTAEVQELRDEVARARDTELATTRSGRERAEQLGKLELATGAVAVSGPGVRVTVDNAPSRPEDDLDDADLGKVQDRDLQLVVNGLWAAGAEAVAVNGYRLTSRTAIRSAGEAILVDFRPVAPPYRVEAIGDPARLEADFVAGPGGRALSTLAATYGIRFSTESLTRATLPAAASLGDAGDASQGGAP